MSTEPSREHVEAVANEVREWWDPSCDNAFFHDLSRAILTSTDPAVLDAMQDALVRAGRLREEKGIYAWGTDDERNETRFVTEWQADQP